ncbi:12697_t:CDS:2, partial [Funneliformis caledonium]
MFYILCIAHGQKNKFAKVTKGPKNFKISALSKHTGTKQHEKAFRLENQKRAIKTVTNNAINKAHQHIIQ